MQIFPKISDCHESYKETGREDRKSSGIIAMEEDAREIRGMFPALIGFS